MKKFYTYHFQAKQDFEKTVKRLYSALIIVVLLFCVCYLFVPHKHIMMLVIACSALAALIIINYVLSLSQIFHDFYELNAKSLNVSIDESLCCPPVPFYRTINPKHKAVEEIIQSALPEQNVK